MFTTIHQYVNTCICIYTHESIHLNQTEYTLPSPQIATPLTPHCTLHISYCFRITQHQDVYSTLLNINTVISRNSTSTHNLHYSTLYKYF